MRAVASLVCWLTCASASAQLPARYPRAPLTEVARAQVGADVARERYEVSGESSVLCLIDTGVDPTHPALAGRVRWVLDAHAPPRGRWAELEERAGGAVWRGDEEGLPGDPHGHGTAMSSIALGEEGLAPGATMIVVRAYDASAGGFPDEAVVRGVRFCRDVAAWDDAIDPARVVALLSLGGHDGAHDGRGAFERALEAEAMPIVVAAGNDGERVVRATGRLFAGERSHVEVSVPRSQLPDAEVALTVLADVAAAIVTPVGGRASIEPGTIELPGARVIVEAIEGDPALRVRITARDGALASGTYRLEVEGPALFEVWLAGSRLGSTFFAPSLGGPHARADEAITIPATAPALIAVGATIARTHVETDRALMMEGNAGERAAFSSLGPTPGGAPKPDLVAPGGFLLAAMSSQMRDGDADNLAGGVLSRVRSADGRVAVRGTSAAAAVVAGALLLALELDPSRGRDARALLIASARGEGAWTPELGAGELDVPRLLALWSGGVDERAPMSSIVATRAFALADTQLWLAVRTRPATVLDLAIGGRTHPIPLAFGTAQIALPPPPVTVGSPIVIDATIDGRAIDPIEVPVVLERGDRGAVALAGGGCDVGRGGRAPVLFVLVLALLGARSRRARKERPPPLAGEGRGGGLGQKSRLFATLPPAPSRKRLMIQHISKAATGPCEKQPPRAKRALGTDPEAPASEASGERQRGRAPMG